MQIAAPSHSDPCLVVNNPCPACEGKGVLLVGGEIDPYARYRCIVPDDMVDAIRDLIMGKKRLKVEVDTPPRPNCGPL